MGCLADNIRNFSFFGDLMVSQKRRRFLIRQKQLRRKKRLNFNAKRDPILYRVSSTYVFVNKLFRECVNLHKPVSPENLKILINKLNLVNTDINNYQLLALKNEHLFAFSENRSIRHEALAKAKFIAADLKEMQKMGLLKDKSIDLIMCGLPKAKSFD